MPSATKSALRILFSGSIILLITQLIRSNLATTVVDFVVFGKIPLTDIVINFEALITGLIIGLWLMLAYSFSLNCLAIINRQLKTQPIEDFRHYLDLISL